MSDITNRLIPYRAFLAQKKEELTHQIAQLEKQNCCDEAALLKIRLNIFGVFETVAKADENQCATWEAFCQRYEPRFETLTAPWNQRLMSAVRNNDSHTRFVEEVKLTTAKTIRDAFEALKE